MTNRAVLPSAPVPEPGRVGDDIAYPSALPFIAVHLACLAAIWTGVTVQAVVLGVALYWLRIFAIGAGYHRYFSHRAFATSRVFQFLLACLAQSTAQRSVLWWAGKHRDHHLHSDTELDVHSPQRFGLLYSHVLWIFARRHGETNLVRMEDFARFPELRWLHRFEIAPAVALALLCLAIGGWPGLVIGFFWSTVAVYHATFSINSLAHLRGRRRYMTGDEFRNNWLLAIVTMGEGWHNNHHAYQASARQGFFWWEYDPTYYALFLLERLGLVWGLKHPPLAVLENRRPAGARALRRAAARVAASFNIDSVAAAVAGAAGDSALARLRARVAELRQRPAEILAEADLPGLPSRSQVAQRARAMLAHSLSLDEVIAAAHILVLEAVGLQLAGLLIGDVGAG